MGLRWGFYILTMMVFFGALGPSHALTMSQEEFDNLRADYEFLTHLVLKIEQDQVRVSPAFSRYHKSYIDYIQQLRGRSSSRTALRNQLLKARLVLFGDEHSNPQSQKNLIWVMEQMAKENSRPTVLLIEWVDQRNQDSLTAYMRGDISESLLREKIAFDSTWGFSWENHIQILRSAKVLGVQVVAAENKTNSTSGTPFPLKSRDNSVVRTTQNVFSQNPESRVLISYGEAHLVGGADPHLREKFVQAGMSPDVVIFSKATDEYWKTLARHLDPEKAEVLRYSATEFFLEQGTTSRAWWALQEYFRQLGLGNQHLNFVKSKLKSSEATQAIAPKSCLQIF